MKDMSEIEKKTVVDIAGHNIAIEYENLKVEHQKVLAERDSLKKAVTELNEYVENTERAKLVPKLRENTNLTDAEINAMSLDDMTNLFDVFKIVKKPLYATSIRPTGDEVEVEQDIRLTVPRKFKYGRKEA